MDRISEHPPPRPTCGCKFPSVWTSEISTARRFAEGLRCGVVWVNKHLTLPPEMPFGGVGNSGFGRENGRDFVYEYTEPKSILFGQ